MAKIKKRDMSAIQRERIKDGMAVCEARCRFVTDAAMRVRESVQALQKLYAEMESIEIASRKLKKLKKKARRR